MSVNDTLEYLIVLTRHVHKGDSSAATLALLIDLDFQPHMDGFDYLRKSILIKTMNVCVRLSEIYHEITDNTDLEVGTTQIDQSIRNLLSDAWKSKDLTKWRYFFSESVLCGNRPSNFVFIAKIACFIELWNSWCKEVACHEQ